MNWRNYLLQSLNRLSNEGEIPRDSSFTSMLAGRDPWELSFPLFQWSPADVYTLGKSFETCCIFGENGAAKSTGSAAWLVLKFMSIGMGGLVCCVKPGDAELVAAYARMTGRADSLIIVSPKNNWRCNLLRYVQKRPGIEGSRVESIVSLLMTIVEAAERGSQTGGGEQKFFERALRQILRNGAEICIAARSEVTMAMLHEVITSAPRSHGDVQSVDWQAGSACYRLIEEADGKERGERQQGDFELAAKYFLRELPDMPADTRGSIMATYGVMADVLLRGHMADLFGGETTFVPEITHQGAIVVLDLPTKIYGQAGVIVQNAFTYLWQTAAEQRDVKANPRPLFWLLDEAHSLVDSHTNEFLATARSSRVASILISQNRPNYLAALGGEGGRHRVDAFLGNAGTKIFHSNGDPETNRWASETISDEVQTRMNYHGGREGNRPGGGGGEAVGRKVLPSEFTQLKKGGAQNGFLTEAIVYQTGASFAANGGEPWLRCCFAQQIPGVTAKHSGAR